MTIALARVRLFLMRLWLTLGLIYCAARLFQASARAMWELFKVSMRGIWGAE